MNARQRRKAMRATGRRYGLSNVPYHLLIAAIEMEPIGRLRAEQLDELFCFDGSRVADFRLAYWSGQFWIDGFTAADASRAYLYERWRARRVEIGAGVVL